MWNLLTTDIIGGATPPLHTTSDNEFNPEIIIAIAITIILILLIVVLPLTISLIKSKKEKPKTYLTKEEIKHIAAYRATNKIKTTEDISFQTLSDEEVHLLQEYRKTNISS